jgi:arylsulfatase A-like enzyme
MRRALLICCLLAAAGCMSETGTRPDAQPTALRFIADDPESLFTGDDLFAEEQQFLWKFRYPWDILWWTLGATSAGFPRDSEYILFSPAGRYPRLSRNAQLDTEKIHVIRLAGKHLGDDWTLYWKRHAERESQDRAVRARPRDTDQADVKSWEFIVAGHPEWTGRLLGMQLQPVIERKQAFEMHSLSGSRWILDTERFDAKVGGAWKVDIKRDVRNALLVPPGHAVTRELTVPADAEFRFAYGFVSGIAPPHVAEPIQFRVTITPETGEAATLYEGKIDSILKGTGAPRWQDRTVDLRPYAGMKVRLTVETTANPTWNPMHGFPFWANPEVLHRIPRSVASDGRQSGGSTPANVVFISIDTLRSDHLSLYGYERSTSPHLDAWAGRVGVAFERAIAQAPWTLPSHVSMFTGLDAFNHQVNYSPAPPRLTMLAEIMRRTGRTTIAVTGGGYVGPDYGFAQGFDRYHYWQGTSAFEMADGMKRTVAWMEENADRPFFFFFHTFEVHSPFRPRRPYAETFGGDLTPVPTGNISLRPVEPTAADGFRTRRQLVWHDGSASNGGILSDEQRASVLALYDSGIAYADALLEPLFTSLQTLNLERDTLVIFTSDHGEAFGEDDLVGHGYLTASVVHVPLVIAFPRGVEAPRTVAAPVRSIDIVPTTLDLLGIPALPAIDGVSLVPLMRGNPARLAADPVPDAWTYAASANYGVSLQVSDEMQYVFNNTPWEPIRGTESFRAPGDAEQRNTAPPGAPALRARMRTMLDERPGLRLRFSNAGAHPFEGALRGAGINTARVKSPDMRCACARWEGGLQFTVPPGETYTVLLENVEADPLHLVVRMPTGAGEPAQRKLEIDPTALTAPRTLAFRHGSWTADGDTGEPVQPDVGVRIWWHGAPYVVGGADAPTDAQLEQLRALGYVQ